VLLLVGRLPGRHEVVAQSLCLPVLLHTLAACIQHACPHRPALASADVAAAATVAALSQPVNLLQLQLWCLGLCKPCQEHQGLQPQAAVSVRFLLLRWTLDCLNLYR
jgi:hypothetical protein